MKKKGLSRREFCKYGVATVGATRVLLGPQTALAFSSFRGLEDYCFGDTGTSRYLKGIFRPEFREVTKHTPLIPVIQPPSDFNISGVFLQQSSNTILAKHTVNYHWFDGDGKPCLIQFKNGVPTIVSRYVETNKYLREKQFAELEVRGELSPSQVYRKTTQGLYGPLEFTTPLKSFRKVLPVANTANTDFFWHKPNQSVNGQLMATWYANTANGKVSSDPDDRSKSGYYLDPKTLETLHEESDENNLRKKLENTRLRGIPAHVKHDRRTNQAYILDHHLLSSEVNVGEVDSEDGTIRDLTNTLELGRKIFFHDWFMNELGVVIPATPFGMSTKLAGKKYVSHMATVLGCKTVKTSGLGSGFNPPRTLVLDGDAPSHFYFVARKDDESSAAVYKKGDVIKFQSPNASFLSHTVNSWVDDKGDIILVASRMEDPGQNPAMTKDRFGLDSENQSPKMISTEFACDLYYWKLPLSEVTSDQVICKLDDDNEVLDLSDNDHEVVLIEEEYKLLSVMNDFPRVNPYYLGYPSQFAYIAINSTQLLQGESHNKLRFDKMLKVNLFEIIDNPLSRIDHSNLERLNNETPHRMISMVPQGDGNHAFGGEVSFISTVTDPTQKISSEVEDQGYLIHVIYDDGSATTENMIERTPLCQCRIYNSKNGEEIGRWNFPSIDGGDPLRIASGAHTIWVPSSELD